MNIERSLYPKLLESLKTFPVVGLVGPRQVGKTSLARQLVADLSQTKDPIAPSAVMLDLERPSDLAKLTEPELFLEPLANRLVVLDEVQLRPDLFPVLRALVDAQRTPGRFLILGSAAPALIQHSSETLAGRIEFLELAPLNLAEVAVKEASPNVAQTLWSRGGFPDSYLARSDAASMRWREAFVRSYLERDIPQLGIRISAATLRRFWLMLAHYHGQLWNASTPPWSNVPTPWAAPAPANTASAWARSPSCWPSTAPMSWA